MRKIHTKHDPCPHGVERTRASADGLTSKCGECRKHRDRNRPNAKERYSQFKAAEAKRREDPAYREKKWSINKLWRERNKLKRKAHMLMCTEIRAKRIIRGDCEICGEPDADAHHDDYTKPLDVRWLCKKHHAEHHKNIREKLR